MVAPSNVVAALRQKANLWFAVAGLCLAKQLDVTHEMVLLKTQAKLVV